MAVAWAVAMERAVVVEQVAEAMRAVAAAAAPMRTQHRTGGGSWPL